MFDRKTEIKLMLERLWEEAEHYSKSNGLDLISFGAFLGLRSALFICGEIYVHDLDLR